MTRRKFNFFVIFLATGSQASMGLFLATAKSLYMLFIILYFIILTNLAIDYTAPRHIKKKLRLDIIVIGYLFNIPAIMIIVVVVKTFYTCHNSQL